jgi:hypothetical protein
MKTNQNIDDFFREAMTGYTVEPSYGLWRRIERRFFPPSRFSPSGLITPIILLFIAGLMPWLLIPANQHDERQPVIPEGTVKEGYLIEPDQPAAEEQMPGEDRLRERKFSVKPTVYVAFPEDPAAESGAQYLASANDPQEDPALLPLLQAIQKSYLNDPDPVGDQPLTAAETRLWISRMLKRGTGVINQQFLFEEPTGWKDPKPSSAFSRGYENDYFKTGEWSAGANFSPSVVFYDPNPTNQMLGFDAMVQYSISGISIRSGLGVSRMEDIGSYTINYKTYDSVGYYVDVVSFYVDPRKPGEVIFNTRQEAIYDSVPHETITEKTNYYTYLDIPLSFGYDFLQSRRITLTAFAGVKFSALIHKEEPTVDFYQSGAEINGIERQVPARMNTNWRFTAGIDFGYLFLQNFSLHLEPVFEQYLTPVYTKQPGYTPRKPYVIGVKAGIRYHF